MQLQTNLESNEQTGRVILTKKKKKYIMGWSGKEC